MDNKKIIDARADAQGNISHVKIEGNSTFTPISTAINMTKQGKIDAVYVKATPQAKEHIRTRPDGRTRNNLDEMAGAKK